MRLTVLRITVCLSLCVSMLLIVTRNTTEGKVFIPEPVEYIKVGVVVKNRGVSSDVAQVEEDVFEESRDVGNSEMENLKERVDESETVHDEVSFSEVESSEKDGAFEMPVLNIVYPASMRKRNIENSFTVRVKVDGSGRYELIFPDDVQKPFVKAVKDAFAGKTSKECNIEFDLPVEFKLY